MRHALFSGLSEEDYAELDINSHDRQIISGSYIYFEAFQHPNIYLLNSGLVRLGYLDNAGNKIVKDILRPGDFFGQVGLQKENLRGEFAQALTAKVSFSRFTLDRFSDLLNSQPSLALKYSRLSGYRIRRFERRMENILRNDIKTRLKTFLEQLVSDFRVPVHLTHGEIAQLIGTSRQTVTAMLSVLKQQHICSYSKKELHFFKNEKPGQVTF